MAFSEAMMIIFGIAIIIFLGKFSEIIFKKTNIPDALVLIIFGILIGPFGLKLITEFDQSLVSIFTTFALLFLLFDGALQIRIGSIIQGIGSGSFLTIANYFVSVFLITGILYLFNYPFFISLLTGFILGGISSSFVIPLLKQIKIDEKTFSQMTLESALTDVFCIVFSLTLIDLINLNTFDTQQTAMTLMSSISVAFFVGTMFALIWLFVESNFLSDNKEYMLTIAVLILTAFVSEFFGGSSALSALFFGIVLKNSKNITNVFIGITSTVQKDKKMALNGELGVNMLKPSEQIFYDQISFFLKTIIFVIIGAFINFKDMRNLIIGGIIILALMFGRLISLIIIKDQKSFDKNIISSVFGRGLAAAALVQSAYLIDSPFISSIADIVYIVITGSILVSCVKVFVMISIEKKRLNLNSNSKNGSTKELVKSKKKSVA